MKIRNGFVSNSSSSSFVCMNCGNADSIYDGDDISDYGFLQCEENGHITCNRCVGSSEFNDLKQSSEDGIIKSSDCPICNLEIIPTGIILKHLERKLKTNKEELIAEIQKEYKNLNDFKYNKVKEVIQETTISDQSLRGLF